MPSQAASAMLRRSFGTVTLDAETIKEIEEDTTSSGTLQAVAVVVIGSIVTGIEYLTDGDEGWREPDLGMSPPVILAVLFGLPLIGWLLWAVAVYLLSLVLGSEEWRLRSRYSRILRPTGFIAAVGIIAFPFVLVFQVLRIPDAVTLLGIVAVVWSLICDIRVVNVVVAVSLPRAIALLIGAVLLLILAIWVVGFLVVGILA